MILVSWTLTSCQWAAASSEKSSVPVDRADLSEVHLQEPIPAAHSTGDYLELLRGKRIAVVANQTSVIRRSSRESHAHLVDSLLALGIQIEKVFAPEHGFRGMQDAGEHVEDQKDPRTGLPIISLYGKNKKPNRDQLDGIDLVLFDIQDVGVRFYTYISTLHYIMEACAELGIPLLLLDRPNPNGHYVDGPLLEPEFRSFVGMHPVPVVYGMTIGEYARMINGEKWLDQGISCDLKVIKLKGYDHGTPYELPVKPSPNLPNARAVNLYPSLCFFEGTSISCGRGTEMQFQVFGSPDLPADHYPFSFTPRPNFGAKHPKHEGKLCHGADLRKEKYLDMLNLNWLIEAYAHHGDQDTFFNDFFARLAGTDKLRKSIEEGIPEEEIRSGWREDLRLFRLLRSKYLLYE
jgi:uncharacterized protein YbbC (DUF1343 family)